MESETITKTANNLRNPFLFMARWFHFHPSFIFMMESSWNCRLQKSRVPICSNDSAEDWVIRSASGVHIEMSNATYVFGHVLKVSKDLRIWAISTGKSFLFILCPCFWCLPVMVLMVYHCYDLFWQQGYARLRSSQVSAINPPSG